MKIWFLILTMAVACRAQTNRPLTFNTNDLSFTPTNALSSNVVAGQKVTITKLAKGRLALSVPEILAAHGLRVTYLDPSNTVVWWNAHSNQLAPTVVAVSGSPFLWTNPVAFPIGVNLSAGEIQGVAVNGFFWNAAVTNGSIRVSLQTNEWLSITNTTVPKFVWKP